MLRTPIRLRRGLIVLMLLGVTALATRDLRAQTTAPSTGPATLPATQAARTPAQRSIARASQLVEQHPGRFEPYNLLALSLTHRARETSDSQYYAQALEALNKSFEIAPDNFVGRKVQVQVLLGRQEWTQALEIATSLNQKMPDDLLVYAFLTDANVELGNYSEAEAAAQLLLDLQPGAVPGLTRGAYLREMFGDVDGAIELMRQAYERTPPDQTDDRAWILTQIAHLALLQGEVEAADKLLQEALNLSADYHFAIDKLAEVRTAQDRFGEAVELRRRHVEIAPHPQNYYYLAQALRRAGQAEAATAALDEFERRAREKMDAADNANRELIRYYAGAAGRPQEALRLAEAEISRRHDVRTRHAYALALAANGRPEEAREQIEKALAVGVRDAELFYDAGAIALAQGDLAAAADYLRKSLELNPHSPVADQARRVADDFNVPLAGGATRPSTRPATAPGAAPASGR